MSLRIRELSAGLQIESYFALTTIREATTKNGASFMTLTLQDRTGTIAGRIWDPARVWDPALAPPSIVLVGGRVDSYRDELQFHVESLSEYTPSPAEYEALMPTSRWDPGEMLAQMRAHIEQHVQSPHVRRMLLAVLDDAPVRDRLLVSAAATHHHHNYRSGLLEHSLSMMRMGTLIGAHYGCYYPGLVNTDLLIAGALLHDLGKVWELEGDLVTRYSAAGNLVGHIAMGAAYVARLAERLGDMPESLVLELQHLVLSHHGTMEFGSPKLPATVEAQLLHYIDNLDARANMFAIGLPGPGWHQSNRLPGRPVLQPEDFRTPWAVVPPVADDQPGPGGALCGRLHGEPPSSAAEAPSGTLRLL